MVNSCCQEWSAVEPNLWINAVLLETQVQMLMYLRRYAYAYFINSLQRTPFLVMFEVQFLTRQDKITNSRPSGGPLFTKVADKWTQLGVVSWGAEEPDETAFDVNTDVSYFKSWILSAINKLVTSFLKFKFWKIRINC